MRLFAKVADAKSFTAAADALDLPKQTLSRRVSELERALGTQLLFRTTRRVQLTDAGTAYAERCAELVRLADEANRALTDMQHAPSGRLRITADPLFGEAFLGDLIVQFAKRWPAVQVDVVLTRRKVDLIEEGFDVAFRVGQVDDPALAGIKLGPARIRYCASPKYLAARGVPKRPDDLRAHECIVVNDGGPGRWPFRGLKGMDLIPVSGRLSFSSFELAKHAALAGAGVALFPEFACADAVSRKRLVSILEDWTVDVGAVWLLYAARRFMSPRVRAFADFAKERLTPDPPWQVRRRAT